MRDGMDEGFEAGFDAGFEGGSDDGADCEADGLARVVRKSHAAVAAALQADAERLAGFKAAHTLPNTMGAVDFAPARGPLRAVADLELSRGGLQRQVGGHWVRADVFDAMAVSARKSHDRAGTGLAFVAPFSPAQVDIARRYAALTERHSAGGMRCASLEAGRGGSGGGSFIDAYLAEGAALDAMHHAIGSGVAMRVRRVRPSARGAGRCGLISDRVLVDAVCLMQRPLSAVLKAHGWSAFGDNRAVLRAAMGAALDRMQRVRA